MHRARGGVLDPWAGLVPPTLLPAPGLDGEPVGLDALTTLLDSPGEFFFRYMLRAWAARRLRLLRSPLERVSLQELLAEVANETTVPAGDVGRALVQAALERLQEEQRLGAVEGEAVAQATPIVEAIGAGVAEQAEAFCRRPPSEGPLLVAEGLPWRIVAPRGRVVGDGEDAVLVEVAASVPKKRLSDRPDLALSARALAAAGHPLHGLEVIGADGGRGAAKVEALAEQALTALREATECARAGRFPVAESRRFGLVGDAASATDGNEGGEP
jgi:hypothetical protein